MVLAELDTRHFTFKAKGEDAIEAMRNMQKACRLHAEEHGLNHYKFWGDHQDAVAFYDFTEVKCWREGTAITPIL